MANIECGQFRCAERQMGRGLGVSGGMTINSNDISRRVGGVK